MDWTELVREAAAWFPPCSLEVDPAVLARGTKWRRKLSKTPPSKSTRWFSHSPRTYIEHVNVASALFCAAVILDLSSNMGTIFDRNLKYKIVSVLPPNSKLKTRAPLRSPVVA